MKEITVHDYTDSCNHAWKNNIGTAIELASAEMLGSLREYTGKVVIVDSSTCGYCVCIANNLNGDNIQLDENYVRLSLDGLRTLVNNINEFIEFKTLEEKYLKIKNSFKLGA